MKGIRGVPRLLYYHGYAMLMSPNKGETAVHSCYCRGDMVVRELAKGTGHTAELVRVHQCIIWYCFVFCVYVIKARVKRLISYVPNLMLKSDNNRTP